MPPLAGTAEDETTADDQTVAELQAELDRWIGEADERREGDTEMFRALVEGKGDLEPLVVDHEVPELVLQDHGHFLGVLLAEILGHLDAGVAGVEGDVKVMGAGQTVLGDLLERVADDAAQRLLDELVVSQQVLAHGRASPPKTRRRPGAGAA